VRIHVKKQTALLPDPPGLAVIQVGENPASLVYVANKRRDCERCGIVSYSHHLEENAGQETLIKLIRQLNGEPNVHGILVQLPLPTGYSAEEVIQAILPEKDVDAFHVSNMGKLFLNANPTFEPCTPMGVIALLDHYEIEIKGKYCVIIGRSNIVGKPMGTMLLQRNATVTLCHNSTVDLPMHTRMADILISAVGKPGLVTADMVKPGAVVIDVGTNRVGDTICGDVDFDQVEKIASHITPVPGGVGPMTRAMLMQNTLKAAQYFHKG
jgi:methylenetetrahydrofolate dehydrogenase (NADP+)/methenyltetrahydrofolate cyclohydrolase